MRKIGPWQTHGIQAKGKVFDKGLRVYPAASLEECHLL